MIRAVRKAREAPRTIIQNLRRRISKWFELRGPRDRERDHGEE
jgi:hypothetical protein